MEKIQIQMPAFAMSLADACVVGLWFAFNTISNLDTENMNMGSSFHSLGMAGMAPSLSKHFPGTDVCVCFRLRLLTSVVCSAMVWGAQFHPEKHLRLCCVEEAVCSRRGNCWIPMLLS